MWLDKDDIDQLIIPISLWLILKSQLLFSGVPRTLPNPKFFWTKLEERCAATFLANQSKYTLRKGIFKSKFPSFWLFNQKLEKTKVSMTGIHCGRIWREKGGKMSKKVKDWAFLPEQVLLLLMRGPVRQCLCTGLAVCPTHQACPVLPKKEIWDSDDLPGLCTIFDLILLLLWDWKKKKPSFENVGYAWLRLGCIETAAYPSLFVESTKCFIFGKVVIVRILAKKWKENLEPERLSKRSAQVGRKVILTAGSQ